MPMVAPLLDAIKRWQRYYRTDLAEAYASVGKEITTWNAWSYDRDWNIWDILRFHWEQTGWLCFYDHDPSLTDGLEPREAGLLSIFFTEKDGLRPPILKRGKTWTFNKTYACSAQSPADQLRQVNTITKLYDNIKPWGPSSWQAGLEAVIYREHFSTDPFLQALITGWHWGNYTCPEYMACAYRFKKGQLWLPRNARDMFRKISNKLLLGDKVCIVYKEPIPEPDKDTWYISGVGVTPSEEE
ncbi:hypothetical protein CDD81_4713 [Ophiocordyceps australis]|uniref:Uncharacterized protein n=1 Tax=Ophiocordyceps australis TaxID=1399860 RepID=A0A2C5Y9G2_9HYPO|nr:hypothetical protein CDD81_4713 [Ophiocordyceps australis]